MLSYAIQLPQDVQNQIVSAGYQYSVDNLVLQAIAQVSSGGNQFNPNGSLLITPFGVGVMGISKTVGLSLGFDVTQQSQNILAAAAYMSALLQNFWGNYPQAIAAYITSIAAVTTAAGVPPIATVQSFVYNVSTIAAQAGSPSVSAVYAITNQTTEDPDTPTVVTPTGTNYLASAKSQAESDQNLSTIQQTLQPQLQIDDPSLSAKAWFDDTGLVTGNPRIRQSVQPVSFIVYLDRNDPTQYLHVPTTNQQQKNPAFIELQLNTSLNTFEITSKHVFTRTPSRTGMHITLWGMQPDLISGTGTTGVFMNQFGLTDFISTANIDNDITTLLATGLQTTFEKNFNPFDTTVSSQAALANRLGIDTQAGNIPGTSPQKAFNIVTSGTSLQSTGLVSVVPVTGDQATLNTVGGQRIAALKLQNPSEAFRVAAQDAFVEFMKLFQMNGNIYFYNQNYNGVMTGNEQQAANVWSPKVGSTSFQQHNRNNDVMSRGYVAMRYRNNVYLGYFKSLSWTQDAESPFQWKFNFTFQVEKTYTALYFPQTQVQFPQALAQILAVNPPVPPPPPVQPPSTGQ
jgi:hypothetical protein